MKHKSKYQLLPWLSAKNDNADKRYIQVGNSLMLNKGFQCLSNGAKWLYMSMCMESGGNREFQFPLSSAKKYGIAERSFRRHVAELVEFGAIKVKSSGWTTRTASDYEFCFDWKVNENE